MFDEKIAHSQGVGVEQILPNENKIVLKNKKTISYKGLVLANGLIGDYTKVEGLEEALKDPNCPVYSNEEFSEAPNKYFEFNNCWNEGEGYYYIPKFPIQGEGENYTFLMTIDYLKFYQSIGKTSVLANLTILNENDCFYENNSKLNDFIT